MSDGFGECGKNREKAGVDRSSGRSQHNGAPSPLENEKINSYVFIVLVIIWICY